MTTTTMNGKVEERARERMAATARIDKLREADWRMGLPGGQWAQFRDPATLTESARRGFKEASVAVRLIGERIDKALADGNFDAVDVLGARQAAAAVRGDYLAIAMFIVSWSYSVPVPSPGELGHLGEIPGEAFDRLSTAAQDLITVAFLDTSVSSEPDAPFSVSGG